jgi:hypothetical protein
MLKNLKQSLEQLQYQRQYREKNREKINKYQKMYYQKNKKRLQKQNRERYLENREKYREYHREWKRKYRKKHMDKIKIYNRKWRAEHREQVRKTCMKSYYKNKEKRSIHTKEKNQNKKFSVLAIYSKGQPKCACCGETNIEFLTIDHVNNDGSKYRKKINCRGSGIYYWLIKNHFPEGIQVLCMNCNFAKGQFGYCPHEFKHMIK